MAFVDFPQGQNEKSVSCSLSVVITTLSSTRLASLGRLLRSLHSQSLRDLEVICVVERPGNNKELILRHIEQVKSTARIIFLNYAAGTNASRNVGVAAASGNVVAFLDDDAYVPPDWATSVVATYEDKSIVGVTGRVLPIWEDSELNSWPEELEWVVGCSGWLRINGKSRIRGVLGTNASFRKSAIAKNGYNEDLGPTGHVHDKRNEWNEMGEETELSLRVRASTGKSILFDPSIVVYHEVPRYKTTVNFACQRSFQVGRTKRSIIMKRAYANYDVIGPDLDILVRLVKKFFIADYRKFPIRTQLRRRTLIWMCIMGACLGFLLG